MSLVEHDLTGARWFALLEAWGGCVYCGNLADALQKDCMLPVSRGGRYTLADVTPACRSCNASKCNAEVTTWLRRRKRDDGAFLLRVLRIAQAIAAAS